MPVRFRPPAPGSKRGYMTSAMTMPVLVLNASYEPVNITRARRALVLLIKGVAVIEEAHDRFVHIGLQLPCVIRLRQYRRLPSRIQTLSRKNILIRDGYTVPILRREVLEQRIGAGARNSARSRRTEHMGKPCSRVPRLQRAQGRPDADGSRHEAAPSTAPRNDSHLSCFNAPDGSRRGEVEEVSVLLKFGRHSSMSECRLGMAKDAG